jgi:hypothetical protein
VNPDSPSLGVRFDVGRIGSSSYSAACWEIFWQAVDPVKLAGAVLYEGDTAASIDGHENVFCVAIQTTDAGALGFVKAALSSHARFNDVCAPPRFVEGQKCTSEPLVNVGTVGIDGQIVGDAWNARPGLDAAQSSGAKAIPAIVERLVVRWDFEAVQELERMCASLPVLSRTQGAAFFASGASAAATRVEPVERQAGRVFEGLMGVVAASDRKDFTVSYDLTPDRLGTGILTLETHDDTIGVLFCAARVSDRSFLTHAFVKRGGLREAVAATLRRNASDSIEDRGTAPGGDQIAEAYRSKRRSWRFWK